eukprot:Rhum_TRINITY_DN11965_c0_g1::Rhum_TRINITY_DN11965_c0_g1_i1::g.48276::m.48276
MQPLWAPINSSIVALSNAHAALLRWHAAPAKKKKTKTQQQKETKYALEPQAGSHLPFLSLSPPTPSRHLPPPQTTGTDTRAAHPHSCVRPPPPPAPSPLPPGLRSNFPHPPIPRTSLPSPFTPSPFFPLHAPPAHLLLSNPHNGRLRDGRVVASVRFASRDAPHEAAALALRRVAVRASADAAGRRLLLRRSSGVGRRPRQPHRRRRASGPVPGHPGVARVSRPSAARVACAAARRAAQPTGRYAHLGRFFVSAERRPSPHRCDGPPAALGRPPAHHLRSARAVPRTCRWWRDQEEGEEAGRPRRREAASGHAQAGWTQGGRVLSAAGSHRRRRRCCCCCAAGRAAAGRQPAGRSVVCVAGGTGRGRAAPAFKRRRAASGGLAAPRVAVAGGPSSPARAAGQLCVLLLDCLRQCSLLLPRGDASRLLSGKKSRLPFSLTPPPSPYAE